MITLKYGQKVLFPAFPVVDFPLLNIGIQSISSDDKPTMVEMEIKKYRESDEDPNAYKVALHPVDKKIPFGIERIYSMDLRSLINEGTVVVLDK